MAFGHASPNSVIGQLSAYATALNHGVTLNNMELAAISLAHAAHSPGPISAATVMAVNANLKSAGVLSVSVSPSQAATIAGFATAAPH